MIQSTGSIQKIIRGILLLVIILCTAPSNTYFCTINCLHNPETGQYITIFGDFHIKQSLEGLSKIGEFTKEIDKKTLNKLSIEQLNDILGFAQKCNGYLISESLKTFTKDRLINEGSTQTDSEKLIYSSYFDLKILHTVTQHKKEKNIILCVGDAHAIYLKTILEKAGYKYLFDKIDGEYDSNNYQYIPKPIYIQSFTEYILKKQASELQQKNMDQQKKIPNSIIKAQNEKQSPWYKKWYHTIQNVLDKKTFFVAALIISTGFILDWATNTH